MSSLTFKKNTKSGICHIAQCTNPTPGKTKLCSTCRSRKCRKADPVRYAYNNLKNHAEARGILFTITLPQFREFCRKVKYIGFKGRSAESYTIDRRHEDIGYHIDNIQVLTNSNNVKKYFSYDWRSKTALVWGGESVVNTSDNPF